MSARSLGEVEAIYASVVGTEPGWRECVTISHVSIRATRLFLAGAGTVVSVLAVFGCGSTGAKLACESASIVGSDQPLLLPPPPRILRTWQRGQRMYMDLRIPPTASDCAPVSYSAAIASTADFGNRAIEIGNSTGGSMPLNGRHFLHLVLRPPVLILPPYTAIASVTSAQGGRSRVAERRLPQKGDYCLLHHPKEQCLRLAQWDYQRCLRAELPKERCTAWTYGTMRTPAATTVRGASVAAVRANVRLVLLRGTYNQVRLTRLTCSSKLVCTALFARSPSEGTARVRYVISGQGDKAGCWFASRIDVIDPPPWRKRSPLEPYLPLNNQAWCLQWRKP